MKGDTDIDTQDKGPFLGRKKGNKLIKKTNRKWKVTGIDPKHGKIEFLGGDKDVTMNANLFTVDLIACDDEGNQHTFRLFGYQLEDV